jgi:hypothetical protein
MSYVARVVWPDGVARFLFRGRLMDDSSNATQHPHPSNAQRAVDRYKAKNPRCIADVIDPNADGAPIE